MNDLIDKLKRQLEAVLAGEATLLEQAHMYNINVERVEEQIRKLLADRKIFGSDDVMDVIMAGYIIGRRDQFFASMVDLFGKETLDSAYTQVCMKLGLTPKNIKQLN